MKYCLIIFFVAASVAELHHKFHRYLHQTNDDKNIIGSSFSAEMAIGMLFVGAGGETAEELADALDVSDQEDVDEKFKDLLDMHPFTVDVANYLIVNNQYSLEDDYKRAVEKHFEGTTASLEMSLPDEATAQINKWVNDRTHGRVQKLISHIGYNVKAILINTIYFKGQWAKQFNPKLTEQELFHVTATKTVPVQMMAKRAKFRAEWLLDLDAKVIELPFLRPDLVMLIYLPNKVDGLAKLEDHLNVSKRPQKRRNVNLRLPKFKISTKTQLKPVFNELGIKKVFKSSANLTGIAGESDFYIDDIIQHAFIEINENGAEAASATEERSASMMDFIVNVPFAFIIRDKDEVYFQGHVNEPEWD